jgi:hypothetical protein
LFTDLDGGGIRGYSSLIIIRQIMRSIKKIEEEELPPDLSEQHSSYYPEPYTPCINNGDSSIQSNVTSTTKVQSDEISSCGSEDCRYLPCHYFDYIGGTSTGGYFVPSLMCLVLKNLSTNVYL